jgi:hypothetical protein
MGIKYSVEYMDLKQKKKLDLDLYTLEHIVIKYR